MKMKGMAMFNFKGLVFEEIKKYKQFLLNKFLFTMMKKILLTFHTNLNTLMSRLCLILLINLKHITEGNSDDFTLKTNQTHSILIMQYLRLFCNKVFLKCLMPFFSFLMPFFFFFCEIKKK